jgi:hypothetical protein
MDGYLGLSRAKVKVRRVPSPSFSGASGAGTNDGEMMALCEGRDCPLPENVVHVGFSRRRASSYSHGGGNETK